MTHTANHPYTSPQVHEIEIHPLPVARKLSDEQIQARKDAQRMRAAGMTYAAIGRMLGVSEETARQYVLRDCA